LETLVKPEQISRVTLYSTARPSNQFYVFAKRLIDIACASAALICFGPLILICMALIAIESPGAPLFLQRRTGKNGRVFVIYKLRSMFKDTESASFRTVNNDHRLTEVGKFLRRTNIDELPQLINIIKGDMSIIGPRPLSVVETQYVRKNLNISSDWPGFFPTCAPGLIGLEQVSRSRALTYQERFKLNHVYETSISAGMDWQILMRSTQVCRAVWLLTIGGGVAAVTALLTFCRFN